MEPFLVIELIVFVFIQGSHSQTVECTIDFDRIIKCEFTPDHRRLTNCSEYCVKVEFSPTDPRLKRHYECHQDLIFNGQCHCTTNIGDTGFLHAENPTVILWRNGQIISNRTIDTENHIKPKTPTIISVNQTSEGKINVTWRTNYENSSHYFSDMLTTELVYKLKQSKDDSWKRVVESAIGKTYFVLIDDFKQNTEYTFKARVYLSPTNFSEWSEQFTFHSGTFVESVAKKVVPVICVILILIGCTISCCYVKIKQNWIMSKDSFSPKIGANGNPTEFMILCPETTVASRMDVLAPKEDIREEEGGITTISVNGGSGNSSQTESSRTIYSSVDHGLICHAEKVPVQNQVLERLLSAVQQDLEQVRQIQLAPKTKPLVELSLSDYRSVDIQKPKNTRGLNSAQQSDPGCTSASSFDNQFYSVATTASSCGSSFFAPSTSCDLDQQSRESFNQPMSMETDIVLSPLVQTELAYQPCGDCLSSDSGCSTLSDSVEVNRTFVSQPTEQKVSKDLFESCSLPPLVSDDEYRSVQSLIAS